MKRLAVILLAFCLAPALLTAQNPRTVIKAIYKPDPIEQVKEKHDKAVKANPGDEPAMQLMEALYLNLCGNPLDGYYSYCASREAIETSGEVAKILKSLQLRLPDLLSSLESASATEILRLDDVKAYDKYLAIAGANSHPSFDVVHTACENKEFSDVMNTGNLEACNAFLAKYPQATQEHRTRITVRRTDLIYRQVSVSTDEATIEQFLADYPDYVRNTELRSYLADLRYARVSGSGDPELMRWYIKEYPTHPGIGNIKHMLSDKMYETLDRSDLKAVAAYVQEYPEAEHTPELSAYLQRENMVRNAVPSEIFSYVRSNGYDASYPRLVRAVARKHGVVILTPDITRTQTVSNIDAKGRIGYWDVSGNVLPSDKGETIAELMMREDAQYAYMGEYNPGMAVEGRTARLNSNANVALSGPDSLHVLTRDGIALSLKVSVKDGRICAFNDRYISTDRGIVDVTNWSVKGPDTYSANQFQKEGLILVCKDGRWGYLDENLAEVIAPSYQYAASFCGGTALVRSGNRSMLIDASGTEVFDAPLMLRMVLGSDKRAEAEHYGIYLFSEEGGCGLVDSDGVVLLEPVEVDFDGDAPAVAFDAEGAIVFTRSGRNHRYTLAELLKKTTE